MNQINMVSVENRIVGGICDSEVVILNSDGGLTVIDSVIFIRAKKIEAVDNKAIFIKCTFFEGDFIPDNRFCINCNILPYEEKIKMNIFISGIGNANP